MKLASIGSSVSASYLPTVADLVRHKEYVTHEENPEVRNQPRDEVRVNCGLRCRRSTRPQCYFLGPTRRVCRLTTEPYGDDQRRDEEA